MGAMPELPEVEYYRLLAEETLGRTIAKVDAPDAWFLKGGTTP
jgi:formamidopyrimidine-DNA glycosylase